MPSVLHGIDLVEVARIARTLERHGDRFVGYCFTPAEAAYAAANPRRRAEHLAARFAAKEAVLKALGTGWARGVRWTDAEVIRTPAGVPAVALHGRAAEIAADSGVASWSLSLTHAAGLAIASAVAVIP